jgi:tRNA threonylcarbamoyladenosine biosynthesis protein TsaE
MLKTSFNCDNAEQTHQLGLMIGKKAKSGDIWNLIGPLGAGKTQFVKGLALGLGFEGVVTSPTFTLQHVYEGRLPLYHFDWYRLNQPKEVEDLGWEEWLGRGGVVAVEWGDKFPKLFPPTTIKLNFEILSDEGRRMSVEAADPESIPRVEELILCWPP